MKFTYSWLKEHLDLPSQTSLDQVVTRLTAIGLEVEAVTDEREDWEFFAIARIESVDPHPLKPTNIDHVIRGGPFSTSVVLSAIAEMEIVGKLAREGHQIYLLS